mgnify:CR=1 FL=1
MGSLTAKAVQSLIKAGGVGKVGDERGLYLKIPSKGEPYWMLRYTAHTKRREEKRREEKRNYFRQGF